MLRRLLLRPRACATLIVLSVGVTGANRSAAQTGCRFGAGTGDFHSQEIPQVGRITWVGRPHFVCSDGVQIWADSAETFSSQNMSHLIGHVRFVDQTRELRADDARYFSRLARLQAYGNLFVRDTVRGSVIEQGSLEYLRQTDTRPVEQMTVTTGPDGVRPRALLYMRPAQDTASADTLAADTTAVTPGEGAQPGIAPDTGRAVPDTTVRRDTARAAPVGPDTARATSGDTAAARDTTRAAPPRVSPDTTGVTGDTTRALPPDTSAAADTTRTGRDTTRVLQPDTAAARDTTLAALPNTSSVRPEPSRAMPPPDTSAVVLDTATEALSGPPPLVRGRPTNPTVTPPDTTQTPYTVVADRLQLHGDSAFTATGKVNIERDSLQAFSDTAVYDQGAGSILLSGAARVESSGYDLSGRTVNLALPGGELSRVRALHDALLTGDQLRMTAPAISVFVNDGLMDRLVATPIRAETEEPAKDTADLAQPEAVSDKFRLTADSLDVRAPKQVLDKMYAVGAARGESSAGDSLNVPELPEDARSDWIEGDTLTVTFVKVEPRPDQPGDSAHYDLDHLVAQGDARSLYRILPSDSTARPGVDPPAVHYVLGTTITIVLDSGQVDHMEVENPTGWHLEPLGRAPRDTLAPADTARGTAADTAKGQTKPDTGVARAKPRPRAGGGGGGSSPVGGRSEKGIANPVSPERERGRRRRRQT